MIAAVPAAEDEIKSVATMASLLLGLLFFFTDGRLKALKELEGIKAFSRKTVLTALPDVGLAAFTAIAVSMMAPLVFDSFSFTDLWRRSGALASMFGLIWLGLTAILLVQLSILWRRFAGAIGAWKKQGKIGKPAVSIGAGED